MIDPELENLCDSVRSLTGKRVYPVDPFEIAKKERIFLAPGDYGNDFDGRIEYLLPERKFVIFYKSENSLVSPVRVRFSVAHELGHYYLAHHRELLIEGNFHDSAQTMTSDKEREREADSFAASLLIPTHAINETMGSKKFLTMDDLVRLAKNLNVSVLASAIRYYGYAEEKCAIILSRNGKIVSHLASDAMKDIGLSFIKKQNDVPINSAATELLNSKVPRDIQEQMTTANDWYDRTIKIDLYEESYSLGYDNLILTLLSVK